MPESNSSAANKSNPKIIIALDFDALPPVFSLVEQLESNQCRLKVGKELFTKYGPKVVEELQKRGFEIFLDLKFHDIPSTVAKAVKAAAQLGVWMVNIHCTGGLAMMEAAKNELLKSTDRVPLLIGVTVLTSMSQQQLNQVGVGGTINEQVVTLSKLAVEAGLDGVVCSAHETTLLRKNTPTDFCLVTPGIRPSWAANDDQHRIVTPGDAMAMGSNYLVIGRPITKADDPLAALHRIITEIESL